MKYFGTLLLIGIAALIGYAVYSFVSSGGMSLGELRESFDGSLSYRILSPAADRDSYRYSSMSRAERIACDIMLDAVKSHKDEYRVDRRVKKEDIVNAWSSISNLCEYVLIVNPAEKAYYQMNMRDEVKTVSFDYRFSAKECEKRYSECLAVIDDIVGRTKGMSDYEAAKFFHDYLILNTDFVETEDAHSAYSCLVKKEAVCDGYSSAYKILCNRRGIPCEMVDGYAEQDGNLSSKSDDNRHSWNIVCLGGKWYHTDLSWDDPVGMDRDYITYEYFNLTYSEMSKDHLADDRMPLPESDSEEMNYFVKSGRMIYSEEDMRTVIPEGIASSSAGDTNCTSFRFADEGLYGRATESFSNGTPDSFCGIVYEALGDVFPDYDVTVYFTKSDRRNVITVQFETKLT